MTIIVGRGRSKATQRIDIDDRTVSREHCWLTDNGDGTYTLENKSLRGTFIDGRQVLKTKVTPNTYIKLSETTTVKVADLLPLAPPPPGQAQPIHGQRPQQAAPPKPQPEFSTKNLESVWKRYHDGKLELQRKQHSMGLLVRVPMLFTAMTGVLSAVLPQEFRAFTIVLTVVSSLIMIYGFFQQKGFVFAEEMDKLDRWFQDNYVCPNPECRHFLGNQPYNILRQDKVCRYCKCKLKDS